MAKLTYEELIKMVDYNKNDDKYGKIFIPNDIFERLRNEEKLTKKGKRTSTYVDVAYSYLFYMAWLYRNAKYGVMADSDSDVGRIKEVLGYSTTNKEINLITGKNGVLDGMGLLKAEPFKKAPILYTYEDDVIEFQYVEDVDYIEIKNKRKFIKYPVFAFESEDGEYGCGTLNGGIDGGNTANTHHVDFDVFARCMTNKELGTGAFYIYSFLKHKCDVAGGSIEIAYDTIQQQTGMLESSTKKAIEGLRKYGLVTCYPAPFIVGADEGEGANIYICNGTREYVAEGKNYSKRQLIKAEKKENEK